MSSSSQLLARSHRRALRRLFALVGDRCPACHRAITRHNDRLLDRCMTALDHAAPGHFAAHVGKPPIAEEIAPAFAVERAA